MTRVHRLGAVLFAIVALATVTIAQSRIVGTTRWSVHPVEAEVIGADPRVFRVFGTPTTIRLSLTITNDSPIAWEVDYGRLRREFQIELNKNDVVDIGWPEDLLTPTGSVQMGFDSTLRIGPKEATSLTIELSRRDGQSFASGQHLITVSPRNAFAELRGLDGLPVRTSFPHSASISFQVGPPANAREQSAMLRLQSGQLRGKNPSEAIRLLQLATSADPSDTRSLLDLGKAYLATKQYQGAISILQRVLQIQGNSNSGHSSVPYLLAFAHVGLGNDVEAQRVLRAAGIQEEGVASTLSRYRTPVGR